MKLVFIQHGSRVRYSHQGNPYVDGNYSNDIWKRYKSYCDELHVVLREVEEKFDEDFLKSKFNEIDKNLLSLYTVPDIYYPKKNYILPKIRKKIYKIIEEQIKWTDKVILRSAGDYYTDIALKLCKKYKKPYLIEAIGFPFSSFWYHSNLGKLLAIPIDLKFRKAVKNASYVLYVTEDALQKKYPSKGKMFGCSDVELEKFDFSVDDLKKRKNENDYKRIILGTTAWVNVKWKGQEDVIKALSILKKKGITNFEYQLVGGGDQEYLKRVAKLYDVEEQISFVGPLPHDKVFEWLNNIDIYIQPSYQEGLCRAIVEAMSKGCAVICSDVGGNYELIDSKYIYKKGKVGQLANLLLNINKSEIVNQSIINFEKSKKYEKKLLNKKRDQFYLEFCNEED